MARMALLVLLTAVDHMEQENKTAQGTAISNNVGQACAAHAARSRGPLCVLVLGILREKTTL
jgi:hypothetical protein